MKTKMRVLKSTDDKSTTTIISIPGCAASGVLKSLHENRIPTDYMGLDQEGRMLMEVSFEKEQDALMKKINEYIKQNVEIANAINESLNDLLKKSSDEVDQMIQAHRKKYQEKRKRSATV